MAINWRRGGVFAAGLGAGLIAALAIVGATRDRVGADDVAAANTSRGPSATATPVAVAAPRVDCGFVPIVPAANREDGLLPLDKDLQGRTASAVNTLILSGKEAAAAGKPRDAETAFLMACRSAQNVQGDPLPLADAHYQLGRHYAQVAASPEVPKRDAMIQRAQQLYASSLALYRTHKGPEHERTRFAQQGLDQLQQLAGGSLPALPAAPAAEASKAAEDTRVAGNAARPAAPAPATAVAPPAAAVTPPAAAPAPAPQVAAAPVARPESRPAPGPQPGPAAAAPERVAAVPPARSEPEPQPRREERRTSPSFDCSKARSTTEKLICVDEDLARQDRELGRIHERAKRAAPDARAFQRDSDAEWQRREEACQDRECLQRWYAQRRAQLSAQAEEDRPVVRRAPATPRAAEAAPERERERERPAAREVAPPAPVAPAAPAAEIVIDGPATASGDIQ